MDTVSEKLKINRSRKRIYQMQHEAALEEEALKEPVIEPAAPLIEEPVVSDTVAETVTVVAIEPEHEVQREVAKPAVMLQEDIVAIEAPHEPLVSPVSPDSTVSAAVISDAPTAVEAAISDEKEREEVQMHDLLYKMLEDDGPEPEGMPEPATASAVPPLEVPVEAAEADADAASAPSVSGENDELFQKAMGTVYRYSAASAATGLIPLPLVDMAGFMATQLLMLRKLSGIYNIPFDSQRSKSAIAILASGINSAYLAASSTKLIPFIGVFSVAAMPAVNGALSYAVGRVFIQHFASGGTFLDFNPEKVRGYFEEQYRTGKLQRTEKL